MFTIQFILVKYGFKQSLNNIYNEWRSYRRINIHKWRDELETPFKTNKDDKQRPPNHVYQSTRGCGDRERLYSEVGEARNWTISWSNNTISSRLHWRVCKSVNNKHAAGKHRQMAGVSEHCYRLVGKCGLKRMKIKRDNVCGTMAAMFTEELS